MRKAFPGHIHRGSIVATSTCTDCRPINPPSDAALVWLEENLSDDFQLAGCFDGRTDPDYDDSFGPEHRQLVQELYLWIESTWEVKKPKCPNCNGSRFYLSRTLTVVQSVPYSVGEPDPFRFAEESNIVDTTHTVITCYNPDCGWHDEYT